MHYTGIRQIGGKMAGQLELSEAPGSNPPGDDDGSEEAGMDTSLVMTWIVDYCCLKFWNEFKRDRTVNSLSERNLLQGLLRETFQCTEERHRLVNFILLIVCLADGQEVDFHYSLDQDVTPLENALLCFRKLMEEYEGPLASEMLTFKSALKLQAVLVCCQADKFELAKEVFDRVWNQPTPDAPASERDVYTSIEGFLDKGKVDRSFLKRHPYEAFVTSSLPLLESVYSQFPKPFLCLMEERTKLKQGRMTTEIDKSSDSSVGETGSRSGELPSNSPIRGFRRIKRSADEVVSEVAASGDSDGNAPSKRKRHHTSANGTTKCSREVLRSSLQMLGLSESDAGFGETPNEFQQKSRERNERRNEQPLSQPSTPLSRKTRGAGPSTSTPRSPPHGPAQSPGRGPRRARNQPKPAPPSSSSRLLPPTSPVGHAQSPRTTRRPAATATPRSLPAKPAPGSRAQRASPEGSRGQRSAAVPSGDRSRAAQGVSGGSGSDPWDESDVHTLVTSGEKSSSELSQSEKPQVSARKTLPKRGKSIRGKKYQPNRVTETSETTDKASADSSGEESDSDSSWPSLDTPVLRRSLDPNCWRGNHDRKGRGQALHKLPIRKNPWTEEETQTLVRAVREFGVGRWSTMCERYDFNGRTNINLKDKWRNMLKNGEI